jgi:uncharacterized protein
MTAKLPAMPFAGHFPGRPPIDAYGNGGFRFADMSHRGHLLFVPAGVFATDAADVDAIAREALDRLRIDLEPQTVLLVGTGRKQVFPSPGTRKLFSEAGIGLEVMDTGAACRTYNVLLAEKRAVAVAVIAVD